MSEPEVLDDEVDLAVEDVCDSQGRRVDSDYVERAVVDVRARRGRPSLSPDPADESHHPPHVSFRVPNQTRRLLDERARVEGASRPRSLASSCLATQASSATP